MGEIKSEYQGWRRCGWGCCWKGSRRQAQRWGWGGTGAGMFAGANSRPGLGKRGDGDGTGQLLGVCAREVPLFGKNMVPGAG